MKTRQIINPNDSPARFQRSDDGFLNATMLLRSYNESVTGVQAKDMGAFLRLSGTKDYIKFLENEYKVNPLIVARGRKGTWMHPHLFIDFAMWVSLDFKDMAIKWVLDGLVKARNDAGDHASALQAAIMVRHIEYYKTKPNPATFQNEFYLLKSLAGITERNKATQAQLQVLNTLQLFAIRLIKNEVGKESRHKQLKTLAEAITV